jgi:hypothetical protein
MYCPIMVSVTVAERLGLLVEEAERVTVPLFGIAGGAVKSVTYPTGLVL